MGKAEGEVTAPVTARKRRKDAVYASNADRQRAYRQRRARRRSDELIRALGRDPRDYPQMSASTYGFLGYLTRERRRRKLVRMVAEYRAEHGLPAQPISSAAD